MKLAYVAFDKTGRQVSDSVEAADVAAASETLRRQGLYVTKIAPGRSVGAPVARARRGSKTRQLRNLAMLARQLHALVSCGTPIVDGLVAMERQTSPGPWRDALVDVRARVEQGSTLSLAMESHPGYFDAVCLSLIRAGESAGNLPDMLDRIAVMTRKQLTIRTAIIGAMVYPALLVGVAVTVLVLMLVLVIPRFGELFKSMDVPLPPTTEALIIVSHAIQGYWWLAILLLAPPVVGLKWWFASAGGRRAFDTVVLRLPQFGRIARGFATARIARLLGVLLEGHVGILEALSLTRQSVTNRHYATLIREAEESITQGGSIHATFSRSNLINPSVCEAIRNGEQSGRVGPLLLNVADFLDEENELILKSLTSLIEPLILVGMGVLVGVVAVSMFMPLFDLTSMAQGGPK